MRADVRVKIPARNRKGKKMLKIPQAGHAKIRIPAGIQPPVEPAAPGKFIDTVIRSSMSLRPVMKQRNRCRMNDSKGRQLPQQPGVP